MVDLRGETDARATALRETISLKLSTSDPKMKREKTTRVSSERGRTRLPGRASAVDFAGHGDRPRDARRSAREGLDDPGYGQAQMSRICSIHFQWKFGNLRIPGHLEFKIK